MEFIRQEDGTLVGVGFMGVRFIISQNSGRKGFRVQTENDSLFRKTCRLWDISPWWAQNEEDVIKSCHRYNKRVQTRYELRQLGITLCLDEGECIPYSRLDTDFTEGEAHPWSGGTVFMNIPTREAYQKLYESGEEKMPALGSVPQDGPYLLHYIPYEGDEQWQLIPSGMVDSLKQHLK